MSADTYSPRRVRHPAWPWMILFLFLTLLASSALIRAISPIGDRAIAHFNTDDQVFTGVITDTRCADNPMLVSDSECIKRCVQSGRDGKYALYDGHALYVLSDQQMPERFIARKVRVRGTLSKKDHMLNVKAIDPA